MYERRAGTWPRVFELEPVGRDPGSRFGMSVAISDAEVVAGAPYGTPAGSAIVFELQPPPIFNYCIAQADSTGQPCILGAVGSVSVAADDLVLVAGGRPPTSARVFLCGEQQAQIPMASGTLCISPFHPGLFRLGPVVPPGGRDLASMALELGHLPAGCSIVAGSTWYFQLWYRDTGPGGYDLSDGLGATVVP